MVNNPSPLGCGRSDVRPESIRRRGPVPRLRGDDVMTAVSGASRSASAPPERSRPAPPLHVTALVGLCGLAVPFVLAFGLRSDIARLEPPAVVQRLSDGGYVLIPLFFVLIGFLLCRPLNAVLAGSGVTSLASGVARRIVPLHLAACAITF